MHPWGATNTGAYHLLTTFTNTATIEVLNGTQEFGIGFAALEYNYSSFTELIINGNESLQLSPANLQNFIFSSNIRNGYLKIETEAGDDLINSITLRTSGLDGYNIDYIVPERK